MTDHPSVLATLRGGEWRRISVDWPQRIAVAGLGLDLLTTWVVLTDDAYLEFNVVTAGFADVHVALAMAYLCALYAGYALLCCLRLGWLSTALAGYFASVMGVFGGLNNLELLVFGAPSSYQFLAEAGPLPAEVLHAVVTPFVGVVVGTILAAHRHGSLPWREVLAVWIAIGIAQWTGTVVIATGIEVLGGTVAPG